MSYRDIRIRIIWEYVTKWVILVEQKYHRSTMILIKTVRLLATKQTFFYTTIITYKWTFQS